MNSKKQLRDHQDDLEFINDALQRLASVADSQEKTVCVEYWQREKEHKQRQIDFFTNLVASEDVETQRRKDVAKFRIERKNDYDTLIGDLGNDVDNKTPEQIQQILSFKQSDTAKALTKKQLARVMKVL